MLTKSKPDAGSLAGKTLLRVEAYGHPDVVGLAGVDTVTFIFDDATVSVSVNPDDDTLVWHEGEVFPLYEEQIRKSGKFWTKYLGKSVSFSWMMSNQGGYQDAVQLMFEPAGKKFLVAQMVAMSSGLALFSLENVEGAEADEAST